jgi:hypothetical protein
MTPDLKSIAHGMRVAAKIMRKMAGHPSVTYLRGPRTLEIVADAVENEATQIVSAHGRVEQ